MAAHPHVLADAIRAKRVAIDNDLDALRWRLRQFDPRRVDTARVGKAVAPLVACGALAWWWSRRRRPIRSLEHVLVQDLRALYASERERRPALAWMRARAHHPELKQILDQRGRETEWQIERLERVFRAVGARPRRGRARAADAIADDTRRRLARRVNSKVRDLWLSASAQRMGDLEVANYRGARGLAEMLGFALAAQLLQQTLDEKIAGNRNLSLLADRFLAVGPARAAEV